jgi:hypothetical protein
VASPLAFTQSAYQKLSHNELTFFLKVRNLPTSGTDNELAARLANHDYHTYHFPNAAHDVHSPSSRSLVLSSQGATHARSSTPDLPTEMLALIMDHVGDWELSRALGIPTSLPQPVDWSRATQTDYATLTGHLPTIRAAKPSNDNPLTQLGATFAVRCGYVNVLEYFLSQHHDMFRSAFKDDLIPIKASRHGRLCVLSWWKHVFEQHVGLIPPPARGTISEAVDGASRNGQVASLDWWFSCGLPFDYTEAALEYASSKNQIAVLDWWKQQYTAHGLPLKIGRAMDMASTAGHVEALEWWATSQLEFKYDRLAFQHASCNGRVEVLDWWLGSGLQLIFDQEALVGATRHNRPEVLEWWDKSGLPIQYRMCDIEEALEDAIGGGEDARKWWRKKGVDFNANDKEWMKLQNLN